MSTWLDTRDLYAELDDLRIRRDDEDQIDPLDEDETERMDALTELFDELGESAQDGETMIPVDEFADYAEQLADDIGAIDSDAGWPVRHIDWKAAADELSQDYTEVSFDGTDYYVRAS